MQLACPLSITMRPRCCASTRQLAQCRACLLARHAQPSSRGQPPCPSCPLQFDKDDTLAVEFVTAAANLRAACYGIPMQSLFDTKVGGGRLVRHKGGLSLAFNGGTWPHVKPQVPAVQLQLDSPVPCPAVPEPCRGCHSRQPPAAPPGRAWQATSSTQLPPPTPSSRVSLCSRR